MTAWPCFAEDEIAAAAAVLRSGRVNYWTGEEGRAFEKEFAAWCNTRYAVAVANGTVALELALHALGIGAGDEVVVPPRTFLATASAVIARGARPLFADVDSVSGNITAETIEKVLTPATRAIIPVHLAGWPCDMDPIMELAAQRNLKVIEDCAQAHGAVYKGRPVGSLGDAAAFSFCQDKIMTTGGEGGMLVTDSFEVWERAWAYKDHGKSYEAVYEREHPPGFRWLHESFGTNWRMTEMQAAIGRLQLRKLPEWGKVRRRNAAILSQAFRSIPALRVEEPSARLRHAYYKYYVYVRPERLKPGWNRDRIMEEINLAGVPCFSGSCSEIYREKAFEKVGLVPEYPLPVAGELGQTTLMFLVHPTLGEKEMEHTCQVVRTVFEQAGVDPLS